MPNDCAISLTEVRASAKLRDGWHLPQPKPTNSRTRVDHMRTRRRLLLEECENRLCMALLHFESHDIATTQLRADPVDVDLDSDGDVDLVVVTSDSQLAWYENQGAGRDWQRHEVENESVAFINAAIGDVDGDGDVDIVGFGFSDTRWYENLDGQGNEYLSHVVVQGQAVAGAIADMDNDGDQDLVAWANDAIGWYENVDGQGAFGPMRSIERLDNKAETTIQTGDLDGDDDPDLIVTSRFHRMFAWYENDRITNQFVRSEFSNRPSVADDPPTIVDIDMDDDLDVLSGSDTYMNDGGGKFTSERTITGATRIAGVIDFDGDGDLDLVTRTNSSVRWRENVGGPFPRRSYVDRQELTTIRLDDAIVIADLDGRGRGNVIVERSEGRWAVLDRVEVSGRRQR